METRNYEVVHYEMPLAPNAVSNGVEGKACAVQPARPPAVAQAGTTTLSSTAYVNMSVMYVLP